MSDQLFPSGGGEQEASEEAVSRAFGADNRNRLIDRYFAEQGGGTIAAADAWRHVYRLLLWSDPTTGLAHCYESDKSQPGKPWYARSLAFHDFVSGGLSAEPNGLAAAIDWLFVKACADLTGAIRRREARLAAAAAGQRAPYAGRGFPEPGTDIEMAALIRDELEPYLARQPEEADWRLLTAKVRNHVAVENKRKNLVGEGFEDVLAQVVRRVCGLGTDGVMTRRLLYEIPGFNRARHGTKKNKVDLAIVQPGMRTLVTAKWSVRADREKQFPTEYDEYINAEAEGRRFHYVFVTNEFDPARLMRACEYLHRNSPMFDRVVHISTDAVRATYQGASLARGDGASSWRRVLDHIDNGRLISLEQWLGSLGEE